MCSHGPSTHLQRVGGKGTERDEGTVGERTQFSEKCRYFLPKFFAKNFIKYSVSSVKWHDVMRSLCIPYKIFLPVIFFLRFCLFI